MCVCVCVCVCVCGVRVCGVCLCIYVQKEQSWTSEYVKFTDIFKIIQDEIIIVIIHLMCCYR